jgi:hypothetical protein
MLDDTPVGLGSIFPVDIRTLKMKTAKQLPAPQALIRLKIT